MAVDLSGLWSVWVVAVGAAWAAAVGWVFGSEAFALYVMLARYGQVFGWQMSGQAVEDRKGFVRMHLAADGTLTLHPLVVDEVCHEWTLQPCPTGGTRPVSAAALPVPRLLEPPIVIAPTPQPAGVRRPVLRRPARSRAAPGPPPPATGIPPGAAAAPEGSNGC